MNYFFKTNNFNLEKYDFDIEFIPKFTKKEHDLILFLLENFDQNEEYSKIDNSLIKINQSSLKKTVLSLMKKMVYCYIIKENKEKLQLYFNLFDFIIIEDSEIIYKFSNEVKNSNKLGNFYARINLLGILKFKFKYTKNLYRVLIKTISKKTYIEYSLDELKDLLGIEKSNYTRYYNFESKVLNPIIKDLESANMNIWFEKIKNNSAKTSRVTGVKIHSTNVMVSEIYKDTNEIIKIYSKYVEDYAKAYEIIFNYRKFNLYEDTIDYIEKNKNFIFKEE